MKMQRRLVQIGKHALNLLLLIIGLALHGAALWMLYQAFLPVAQWYWDSIPMRGVDLHNATTYVAYLGRHFAWLPAAWKYIFFNGEPLVIDYPSLHFYLTLPFLQWFTPVRALQLWMLISTFLFFVFSYLLYARLAKMRWIALLLGVFTVYSVNVYGALIWGGSIPYYGTQFFLPLTLYFLVCYFQTGKRRWFAGAILALGISQYGHSQIALSYGLVLSVLSLIIAPRVNKLGIKKRMFEVFGFLLLVFLIGLPVTGSRLGILQRVPEMIASGISGEVPISYSASSGPSVSEEVREFYRTRIYHFFTDTHRWMFWVGGALLAVYFILYFSFTFIRVLAGRKRKRTTSVYWLLWVTILLGYVVLYLYLYSVGIDIFHGGWYRVFWPVPVLMGMFGATVMGGIVDVTVGERKDNFFRVIWLIVDAVFIVLIFLLLPGQYNKEFETTLYRKSVASGGFPGTILAAISREDQERFAESAVPEWIDTESHDYRLYSANQVYNMWFNSYFDLPLARGYIDPTITSAQRWGIFLMDIVLDNDVAMEKFDYPLVMAKNAARFVLDWNAIRYLAGETKGTGSTSMTLYSSYITTDDFISRDEDWETKGGRLAKPDKLIGDIYDPDASNWVRYLEVKEELVSPILSLTNSPSVLFIGDEPYWEIFVRTLAQMGITSKELIPVKGSKFLDKVEFSDLLTFDAVFLYGYDYKNSGKAWLPIEKYVEQGGRLFVDTGAEVKESASVELPPPFSKELSSVFPIRMTSRGDLGEKWDVQASSELLGVDFLKFSPLIYDEGPWNVSYAEVEDVDESAQLMLTLADKPVVVSWEFGEGEVVWSGMNLPAHMERNRNVEEGKLFKRLINELFLSSFKERGTVVEYEAEFISSERRKVKGTGGTSVLFKESNFPGWKARVRSDGKAEGIKIWRTGFGYPGVMWVKIPSKFAGKQVEVEFIFRGAGSTWLMFVVSGIVGIVLVDKFVFNGKVFGRFVGKIWGVVQRKVGSWWEKEDDE